jgi:hypothetical protein
MMRWLLQGLRDSSGDSLRAARLLIAFTTGTFVGTLIFGALFVFLQPRPLGVFVMLMAAPIGGAAFVVRWSGSVPLAGHVYLLSVWIMVSGVALVLGGVQSPAFPAYAVLILGATFMIGRRSGIAWTVIAVASILVIELTQGLFLPRFQISNSVSIFFSVLSLSVVSALVCLFALLYDDAKSSAVQELRGANQRIAQMIVQLEQASERLILSSERFLGRDATSGLIGRMMRKTRSGHIAIEESRTSVSGMIDQYRQISARVQELHRYSQRIVEMVSTIDRISDRLDMMALNVGIEASRTGEAGRQFSILASDMRLLAERVLAETRQIQSALQSVHAQIDQVRQSSASGQILTEVSASKITAMAETFHELYTLVEETESAAGQITEDTLAQLDAVRRLVSAAATVRATGKPASAAPGTARSALRGTARGTE